MSPAPLPEPPPQVQLLSTDFIIINGLPCFLQKLFYTSDGTSYSLWFIGFNIVLSASICYGTLREYFLTIKIFGVDNYSCNLFCTFSCKSFYIQKASGAGCVICCFIGPADSKPGDPEIWTGPDEATRGSLPPWAGRSPKQLPSALSSVTRACLVCGQYDWVLLMVTPQGAFSFVASEREDKHCSLGSNLVPRSGSHRIDNTQKHRQRFGTGWGGGDQLIFGCIYLRGLTDCDTAIS